MANIFFFILLISTITTGILWFIELFKTIVVNRRLTFQYFNKKNKTCNAIKHVSSTGSSVLETLASIFPVLLIVLIVRSFIYEPYQIPSGSMMPTLMIGDFILVEKFAYGIKNPITHSTIIETNHPKRGDIVVFKYPPNPNIDYIKRVIGLPGDKVIYNQITKCIIIKPNYKNNKRLSTELSVTYGDISPSNLIQIFYSIGDGKVSSNFIKAPINQHIMNGIRLAQRKEYLDGVTHNILIIPEQEEEFNLYQTESYSSLVEWIVPKGKYFMMGDNRDNSSDSRFWGFVPEKNLVGKATAIWMSFKKQEGQWPTGITLNRIGRIQ